MPETMTTSVRPARSSRRMESHTVNPIVRTISPLAPVTKKRVAAYARVSTDEESQEWS